MKSLFLILLFSLLIIGNSILENFGGWKKGSYRENDMGIDRAFKRTFEYYLDYFPDADIDFTYRLTVYRQIANGINYLMCFIDLKKNLNVVQECIVNNPSSSSNNRNQEFNILEKNYYKPKKGLLSVNDPRYPRIQNTLYGYTKKMKQKLLYINKIEIVETTLDTFYIIDGRAEDKEHIYVVGQSKQNTDEYEAYGLIQ